MTNTLTKTSGLKATVHRLNSRSVSLCWAPKGTNPLIALCSGRRRAEIVRKISVSAAEAEKGCVQIGGLAPARQYYFHLTDETGSRVVIGERQIMLEGAVNFRDIGGYKTSDGREVKWGRVFRSDGLARLTAGDHVVLQGLGIRRVFDFRTAAEVAEAPDHLPADGSVRHINLPVTHGKIDFIDAMTRLKTGDISWLSPEFMVEGYIQNLEQAGPVWGEVINSIAASDEPAFLFHCTGGKDRTGTCAALILLMLGVAEDSVIQDHQLSNDCIAAMLPKVFEMMASWGVDPEKLVPYFTAPIEGIQALLAHLRTHYGTAARYLETRAAVTIETQERLKSALLR